MIWQIDANTGQKMKKSLMENFIFCPVKLLLIPVAEYASFSHQVRALETNLLGLISIFLNIA